jgi:transcription elongation factor SPT5
MAGPSKSMYYHLNFLGVNFDSSAAWPRTQYCVQSQAQSYGSQVHSPPPQILSTFQCDSLPSMIYVEARCARQVNEACNGLLDGMYPSHGITLIQIEGMASLLQIKKQDRTVTPGSWVRIKHGRYQGDFAQVMDITKNGEDVGLKFISCIDLNPRDNNGADANGRKLELAW